MLGEVYLSTQTPGPERKMMISACFTGPVFPTGRQSLQVIFTEDSNVVTWT